MQYSKDRIPGTIKELCRHCTAKFSCTLSFTNERYRPFSTAEENCTNFVGKIWVTSYERPVSLQDDSGNFHLSFLFTENYSCNTFRETGFWHRNKQGVGNSNLEEFLSHGAKKAEIKSLMRSRKVCTNFFVLPPRFLRKMAARIVVPGPFRSFIQKMFRENVKWPYKKYEVKWWKSPNVQAIHYSLAPSFLG